MNRRTYPTAVVGFSLLALVTSASAQDTEPPTGGPLPSGAQLGVRVSDPALASYGGAVERVVRSKLDEHAVVRMSGTPALAFDDLQLMVGCLGETAECLGAIATQLSVEMLIMASVDLVDDERVLTVTVFDARDASSRAASRRVISREGEHLVASVDGIVRELFGLPPAPELEPDDLDLAGPTPPPAPPPRRGTLVPGLIVAGVGVASLAAGLGVGLAANGASDEYRDAPTRNEAEVDAALTLRARASRRATTANALFITGGVLTAAGVVLAILLGRDPSDDRVRVDAAFGPGFAGLTLGGSL